jgi:topoisomerase IV subunit A
MTNLNIWLNKAEGVIILSENKPEIQESDFDFISRNETNYIIVIRKDGIFKVLKIDDKNSTEKNLKYSVGEGIIHCACWHRNDSNTTYNLFYSDGATGISYAKKFDLNQDSWNDYGTEKSLTQGTPKSEIRHLSCNSNKEIEIITIQLTQSCSAKIKRLEYDFAELDCRKHNAKGNQLTKYPIHSIEIKQYYAPNPWISENEGKINFRGIGKKFVQYTSDNKIFMLFKNGKYSTVRPLSTDEYAIDGVLFCEVYSDKIQNSLTAIYKQGDSVFIKDVIFDNESGYLFENQDNTEIMHIFDKNDVNAIQPLNLTALKPFFKFSDDCVHFPILRSVPIF